MLSKFKVVSLLVSIIIGTSLACKVTGQTSEYIQTPTEGTSENQNMGVVSQESTATTQTTEINSTPIVVESPNITPIGYNYTLESGNDGWSYGRVGLAFINNSDTLAIVEDVAVELYVETEEGQDYPAVISKQIPNNYDISPSKLNIGGFSGMPPGFVAINFNSNVETPEKYFVFFRVAEITHPTKIVFPSLPQWNIELSNASITDIGFPGEDAIKHAVPISNLAGLILDEISGQAIMRLNGSCSIETTFRNGYYHQIHLNYSIENTDTFQGVNFTGELDRIALTWNGIFLFSTPLFYKVEVGPGQTIENSLDPLLSLSTGIDETIPSEPPVLLVLYGSLSNSPEGYSIISLDSCSSK